jgi:hypothetical protein
MMCKGHGNLENEGARNADVLPLGYFSTLSLGDLSQPLSHPYSLEVSRHYPDGKASDALARRAANHVTSERTGLQLTVRAALPIVYSWHTGEQ